MLVINVCGVFFELALKIDLSSPTLKNLKYKQFSIAIRGAIIDSTGDRKDAANVLLHSPPVYFCERPLTMHRAYRVCSCEHFSHGPGDGQFVWRMRAPTLMHVRYFGGLREYFTVQSWPSWFCCCW